MPDSNNPQMHLVDVDRHGFVAIVMTLFGYRRWLAGVFIAAIVLSIAFWKLAPSTYRAEASFLPSSKILGDDDMAQMGALRSAAMSLGVAVPGGKADPSLLFEDILKSRTMIDKALSARLADSHGTQVPLLDAIRVRGSSLAERRYQGEMVLRRKMLRTSVDMRTGITRISIGARDPELAANLANYMVAQIDSLSRGTKVSYAGRQVSFISERLVEVGASLKTSEDDLRQFRTENRITSLSPELMLEQERLERNVHLNEQLYLTLRTQLEVVKIEEVKSLPMLVSIDRAIAPAYRESPRLGKTLIRFTVIGLGLAMFVLVLVDYFASARDSVAVLGLRAGLTEDLRRIRRRRAP